MPFCSELERDMHFKKHRHEFNANDAADYERMADEFMSAPLSATIGQCVRPPAGRRGRQPGARQDRVRFGFNSYDLGVSRLVPVPECIKTFYKIAPHRVAYYGGPQRYLNHECARMDV